MAPVSSWTNVALDSSDPEGLIVCGNASSGARTAETARRADTSLAEHRFGRAWVWTDQSQTAPTDALRTVPVSIRAESEAKSTAVLAVSAVLGLAFNMVFSARERANCS